MVRQDFNILPPKPFLMQIMDPLTKEYCFLWEKKDLENRIKMTWEDLIPFYNKNSFRTGLRKLNEKGLLSYAENKEGVSIEMIAWEEIEDNE
jgi:hypothetical protein